jgi:hypothetical protein
MFAPFQYGCKRATQYGMGVLLMRHTQPHREELLNFTFRSFFVLLSILAVCFIAAPVWADTVPIANPSFEITNPLTNSCGTGCAYNSGPIPGWTTMGGQAGSWQPNSTYFTSPVPDGSIIAYSNGGSISQTLSASLIPNMTYTLSVAVGDRLDPGFTTTYTIALYAGSILLSSITGSNATIPSGTFQDESLSYHAGAAPLSGQLGIVLTSVGPQSDFDNVRLTATPEPGTLALMATGLGLMFLVLRRR